jgi:transposase
VCFSDESNFEILADKAQFVRRRSGEANHLDCVIRTVKHPLSIMVWSVISSKGTGRLYIVEGTMRQDQYKKILETKLIPQLRNWFQHGERFIFMQDGAPCHTAKSVSTFLRANNIPVLPWPGNSPDMNPIENLWELVKRRVSENIITTKKDLIEKLIAVWHRDPEVAVMAANCIKSMPRRVEALLKAKGGSTKY